jgi:hypothetical protein
MHPEFDPSEDQRPSEKIVQSEHTVQFYETDQHLIRSLTSFFREGLFLGASCVIVATAAHREALDGRLLALGAPLARARSQGRFQELDASETIGKFMVDGRPDEVLFRAVTGPLLAPGPGPTMRVFGEMVALLWAEGNRDGAIRLEELWNDAARQYSFHLLCAYPRAAFDLDADRGAFASVCNCHNRVLVS